jgi:hypothetical protein
MHCVSFRSARAFAASEGIQYWIPFGMRSALWVSTVSSIALVVTAAACSFGVQLAGYFGGDSGLLDSGTLANAQDQASDAQVDAAPECDTSTTCSAGRICDLGVCRLPKSCAEIYEKRTRNTVGEYLIDPDVAGPVAPYLAYCDLNTPGGWTLVFVGRGKEWLPRYQESVFALGLNRAQIAEGTRAQVEYRVLRDWPEYRSLYYERWLPSGLTGRTYAQPGWSKRPHYEVAETPTSMNFWSAKRSNREGWLFGQDCPRLGVPSAKACDQMPNGKRGLHIDTCEGCLNAYLWFQTPECATTLVDGVWVSPCGLTSSFFPDRTYGYWRITDAADFTMRWPEYDALTDGQPMPGYGLYVH